MPDSPSDAAEVAPKRPMPRPPGAAVPRRPQAPNQRGGALERPRTKAELTRRVFSWLSLTAWLSALGACTGYFFFPRTIREKKTSFTAGYPSEYPLGVDERWQKAYRVWIVRDVEKIFAILAVCTHLGCTPDWKATDNKFKCPCHGSGYDAEGVNFEGPAPRPMDRCHVELAPDGQIVVDTLRTFRYDKDQWGNHGAFIRV